MSEEKYMKFEDVKVDQEIFPVNSDNTPQKIVPMSSILDLFNKNKYSKVYITDKNANLSGEQSNLNVVKETREEYVTQVLNKTVDPRTIYVVENDNLDAYGQRVVNVADPIEETDAVNLKTLKANLKTSVKPSLCYLKDGVTTKDIITKINEIIDVINSL